MGIAKKFNFVSEKIYRKLRASGKQYYLRKTAKKALVGDIDNKYKKEIISFYAPYIKASPIFHMLYKRYTGIEDVRFIPDDIFANYIDQYFNLSRKAVVLENKCYFEKMFIGVKQPKCIASRMNNLWFSGNSIISLNSVKALINGKAVVIKQACGSGGGHDVYFLNEADTPERFEETIGAIHDDIVIQELIQQHEVFSRINASSVNTVRVLSMLSNEGVKIYSCFLRCGRGNSRVDNASVGGLICGIDTENGHLRKKAISLMDYNEQFTEHPDTGVVFEKIVVPSWEKIQQLVQTAAPQIPHSRMVAWDITVDVYGEPVLIEANLNNSLVNAHQIVNGPVFKEDTEKILKEVFYGRK